MRSKQKNKTENNSQNTPALTFITKTTEIKADLQCDLDIRIAGSIEGNVESQKKVILSNSGKIKGSVISSEAEIFGEITGDIKVENKITLRASAIVEGEVSAKIISIDDGAQLRGSLHVGPEIKVQKPASITSELSA